MARCAVTWLAMFLAGCAATGNPADAPGPTTAPSVPREHVVLSTRDGLPLTASVPHTGQYWLYMSKDPRRSIGVGFFNEGDTLTFRARENGTVEAEVVGFNGRHSYVIPARDDAEYFWTDKPWKALRP